MPLFMDRHDSLNATAKDLAKAHQLDIKIQGKFDCKALTYWYDEGKHIAFCLIEAPDKKAVEEMHRNSHGLVANQIIEVQSNLVENFLGRISDPAISQSQEQFISETAFRSIMYINCNCFFLKTKSVNENQIGVNSILNNLVRPAVKDFDGTEVKINSEGFMVSFTSVSKSIKCALKIQANIIDFNKEKDDSNVDMSIGLSAGYPVTTKKDFFGDTLLLAKRLSEVAIKGEIVISSELKNLFEEELDLTKYSLKVVNPSEEKFLNQLMELTEKFWNNSEINIGDICKEIGYSKAQLYRKTISLTGTSLNNFIRNYRLNKALKLIEKKNYNISEIAFESGFSSPSYFAKCFQKRYGIPPSDHAANLVV